MNVRTGFTPAAGRGYRVSVNVDCANPQNKFEIFYDGAYEAAYGAIYERYLNPGRNTFSFMIMPATAEANSRCSSASVRPTVPTEIHIPSAVCPSRRLRSSITGYR
jgi:hypothetical protein